MTGQERDCDEVLCRVLHSTTDQIEPVGDGLTKIQARLAEPWLKRQWWLLRSELMVLGWVLTVRCQSWLSTVRSGSPDGEDGGDGTAGEANTTVGAGAAGDGGRLRSLRPVLGGIAAWASGKRPHKSSVGLAMAWLRPALAVAGAVVLVVAGVFALAQIRAGFVSLSAGGITPSTSGQAGGPGSTNGRSDDAIPGGQSPSRGNTTSARPGNSPHGSPVPSPANCATPTPPPISSPTPSPTSQSPTPSPTSASPTPTPTTASPTPSTSSGPAVSGTVAGGSQVIKTAALVVCGPALPSAPASPANQASSGA